MGQTVDRRRILRLRGIGTDTPHADERPDQLAVEAPLTIKVDGTNVATTMRTPGQDLELAFGWLVAEGTVTGPQDVRAATTCADDTVELALADGVAAPRPRLTAVTSACGVCGTEAIAEVLARRGPGLPADRPLVHATTLTALPDRLRLAQRGFARSGGLHAAGLFTADGEVVCVREDVGRHNAVDKVVGWLLHHGGPARGAGLVLQVSGRASFELTQKAAMAGIPVLSAISAPSTLAVDLSREAGLTLVGFARGDSLNVYTGQERILHSRTAPAPSSP